MSLLGGLLLAAALPLGNGNAVRFRPVEGRGLAGTPAAVADGILTAEGAVASEARSALLADERSVLVVPLGTRREIRGVVLECEADDEYLLERSLDGHTWFGLLDVKPAIRAKGMQVQSADFATPQPALFLAVHARGGDGHFAVAELQAFETLPAPWPPQLQPLAPRAPPPPVRERAASPLTSEVAMIAWKGGFAAAGVLLLAWGAFLARAGRSGVFARTRDALLALLGAASLAAWWNFGHFHHEGYVHVWDSWHYVMGAKYFPELGYTGLYECTAAADLEAGRLAPGEKVRIRDLTTNTLVERDPAALLPGCRARFRPDRWETFARDVSFFRGRAGSNWTAMLRDHGYNATPAWGVLGRLLASGGPLTDSRLAALAAVDSLLLLAMWGAVLGAFGWRTTAVAALLWGTSFPSRFYWNGGAFLRMDWLVCAVVAVCLLRKGRFRGAGALLALAALLRVFPALLLLGLLAAALARSLRARRAAFRPEETRIAQGALLAIAVVLPLSLLVPGRGLAAWPEFAANSAKHLATPLTNNVGMKTLLAFRPESRAERTVETGRPDPFERWKAERRGAEKASVPVFLLLSGAALAFFAWTFRESPAWVVAAAAAGLVPFAAQLTCYYLSILLLLALLHAEDRRAGIACAAFAAASCLVPALVAWDDVCYAILSALALAAVVAVWVLPPRGSRAAREAASAPRAAPGPARRMSAAAAATALCAGLYVHLVAPETIRQHRALETRAYDMGITENVFWNSVHGRLFDSSIEGGSHLGVHTSFIYLAALPFYAALPRAETLLVLQTLLLALAAWPLFLVARRLGFSPWQGAAVAACWLVHPAVGGANFYDFHELAFGPVLFFAAFLFLLRERWLPFGISVGLLLLVKEDLSIVVAALGVWCLLTGRKRAGAALVAVGVAAYAFLQLLVIPWFAGGPRSFGWYYSELIPPGEGPSALVEAAFLRPLDVARVALRPEKLLFVAQLLLPLLFACLLSLRSLALVAYGLLASLCATRPYLHRLGFQYPLQILPYAFAGALETVAGRSARSPRLRRAWVAACVAASLVVAWRWGALGPAGSFAAGFREVSFEHPAEERERYEEVRAAADSIPPESSVTASETLVPHVARRPRVFTLRYAESGPSRDADYYFVLASEEGELSARHPDVLARYDVVRRGAATLLLRRHDLRPL